MSTRQFRTLSKRIVDRLSVDDKDAVFWDRELPGFGLRVYPYRRKADAIAAEAALDGLYIVRTSVPATELDAEHTMRAYKGLSVVERAFRSLKTVDLKVRPIYHYAGARVRAHVFLCMLAYYVEWHMRQRLKPLLFDDEEPDVAEAARPSVVAPAEVSPAPAEAGVQNLFRLRFLDDATNVVLVGGVGLGKSHLVTALGLQACERGYSVLFTSAIDAINTLAAAKAAGQLKRDLRRYLRPRLLILDELGYNFTPAVARGAGGEAQRGCGAPAGAVRTAPGAGRASRSRDR